MATVALTTPAAKKAPPPATPKYGSMKRDRIWALRWSYFFLVLFAIFFLLPPVYMLITSLKTSGDLGCHQSLVGLQPDAAEL